jgi:hypothetical protein
MHKPVKYVEKGLTYAAGAAWGVFSRLNRIRPNALYREHILGEKPPPPLIQVQVRQKAAPLEKPTVPTGA